MTILGNLILTGLLFVLIGCCVGALTGGNKMWQKISKGFTFTCLIFSSTLTAIACFISIWFN